MNVSITTFSNAFHALDSYADSLQTFYEAERVATEKYVGIYKDTAIEDAEKLLKTAADRTSVIVCDAIDKVISEYTDTGVIPESAFSLVSVMDKELSAPVCDSICKTYAGNNTALRFLHDIAHDINKPMIASYMLDIEALQTAKKDMLHIADKPSALSIRMHGIRQELRKAADCLRLAVVDTESEAYTNTRLAAMAHHVGILL